MKLYCGSNVPVKIPEIRSVGFYKDFGYGFYCTAFEKQAMRWALIKRPEHIVSVYDYTPDKDLKVFSFPSMTEEWLDFVVDCRREYCTDMMWWKVLWLMIRYGIMWKISSQETSLGKLFGYW